MKLSTLVAHRNLIQHARPGNLQGDIDQVLAPLVSAMMVHDQGQTQLDPAYKNLCMAAQHYDTAVDGIVQTLQQQINQLEPQYFSNSYGLYEKQLKFNASDDHLDIILQRSLAIEHTARQHIQSRITLKGDWHRPAMILRPSDHEWITKLVACDPLYLVDYRSDLLDHAVSKFNVEYQRRLRCYTIDESREPDIMHALPNDQFGFVLIYNFFHYRPFEVIKTYLVDIYKKLVPGGVVGFTFNDCDRPGAVDLVEKFYMCYTPGNLLCAMIESLGYQIQAKECLDQAVTWMEIAKPGHRPSLRGGQSLATVHDATLSRSVDHGDLNTYTSKQRRVLIKQAHALGIDHADTLDSKTLEMLINERKTS